MDVSEKNFESTIEAALLAGGPAATGSPAVAEGGVTYGELVPGGYRQRSSGHYHRTHCLDADLLYEFILATQPKMWARYQQQHGADARESQSVPVARHVKNHGTSHALRRDFKATGCTFRLAYFRPNTSLNADTQMLYEANIFSVVRQLRYSDQNTNTLDLALFLNGLPIFTAELKNPFTGQNVEHAMHQYRHDRDPRESLFAFGRCLAHFAVDPDLVYMTTHLRGEQTTFLPFNQGKSGGAGNPTPRQGFATAYLWEQVWARDSVLNLIRQFIQVVQDEDDEGKPTGQRRLIFPRYHQLDAVRRLVADARANGPGQRYLIQHSAGSGKSNSIAWLAHQLSVLHNAGDRRVFDSIVVVTDRKVLDRQLQGNIKQFEDTPGIVENIDETSRQLKQALEDGKTIIVTTLQKFPVIAESARALPGKRFALIVDEAHSSQSGEAVKDLKAVLRDTSLDEAEALEADPDEDDPVTREARLRQQPPNVSTFALTATPKQKTLELFGTKRPGGGYDPFSLYSMRQAIEEKFILDVLQNYTEYRTYWSLLKKVEADPRYDRAKASHALRAYVDLHPAMIDQKAGIMVEHFVQHVCHRVGGRAKAMIVTRSRLHAVRYQLAVDRLLKERGVPYRALVAFSGTVSDEHGDYTESGLNGLPESATARTFKQADYRLLIVANKFQTGFDAPLLHTMYVDKKLGGVNAVQTLSRLNRIAPGKTETMVLDFANTAEEIQAAFQPYYERTILTEGTDPNRLYDLQTQLEQFPFFGQADVDAFAAIWFGNRNAHPQLHAALAPVVDRVRQAEEQPRLDFRGLLVDYVRLYAFLSQVVSWVDGGLEKLYVFARFLLAKLPVDREELPLDIQQHIDMDSLRIVRGEEQQISLARGQGRLEPPGEKPPYEPRPETVEPLSMIVQELNERFGTDFTEDDKVCIAHLEAVLDAEMQIATAIRTASPENARYTFELTALRKLQDLSDTHFKFFQNVVDNAEFKRTFLDMLFDRFKQRAQSGEAPDTVMYRRNSTRPRRQAPGRYSAW